MKANIVSIMLVAAFAAFAQVKIVKVPLSLNGDPERDGWKTVPVQTGFCCLQAMGNKKPDAQTEFKVASDSDSLYLSVLCRENQMKKLRKSPDVSKLWSSDSVEIFLAPSGRSDEFYQFAVSAGNLRYSMFYGEAGVIKPDPYQPFWESKVFYGKDHWLVQLRIPFSAFYMTRNEKWRSEWLLNIARSRKPVSELSSWSLLKSGFRESQNFRKFKGFPQRDPAQDIAIKKVTPDIQNYIDGVYSGPLHLTIEANPAAAGMYELKVEEPEGKRSIHTIALKSGLNRVTLPTVEYLKKAQGKTDLKLTLKSLKNGNVAGRSYPVSIVYLPIRINLTAPGYKRNFYPGQDYSEIRGELKLRLSPKQRKIYEIRLSVSGGGLKEQTLTFKADREAIPFRFDSRELSDGGRATLSAKIMEGNKEIASASCPVTRLKKNNGSMIWIENNVLIKNGKPWYPRFIYASGYMGGTAFGERYHSDQLAESPFLQTVLEPFRLIPGIESKEATRDVKPCPELFEKIRRRVEEKRSDPKFDLYYICDEPEYRNISPIYLKYIYDFVSELDPYHPMVTCTTAGDKYLDCADVFAPHPYLMPVVSDGKRVLDVPIHRVRNYLQNITKFNRQDKVIGFTGQFFSYKFNNVLADYPTWEELESMSWSAIVQGSRFHFPYAYHDLGDRPQIYEGYRYFNQSIQALESLLLSNRKHPVKAVDPENMIDALLVDDGNATLLVVVNLKNSPLETEISAEHLKQFKTMLEFRGTGTKEIVNGKLKLSLKPYECVVLTSKKLDSGLKTRDQVVKEIATAGRARAVRGNLLFEKGSTFEVDSSKPGNSLNQLNKLFDGTIDVIGWQSAGKDAWYELNFRKNPPKFSKIGIYGCNMGNPSVKIWKFGEWKNLTLKKVTKTKYSVVLDFGEELKSVKIRIDFPDKIAAVELYEIELLK